MTELIMYCHSHLKLNNAQIGRIFRRERSNIHDIVKANKPKGKSK